MNWKCSSCGIVVGARHALDFADTLIPAVKLGMCPNERRRRSFRPVNEAADAANGRRAAERGMMGAELAEMASGWTQRADTTIKELAASGERFTAETLVGRIGAPSHRNSIGPAFNRAAKRGLIKMVGTTTSSRPESRSRRLPVWIGGAHG